jgi:hypothetical protein
VPPTHRHQPWARCRGDRSARRPRPTLRNVALSGLTQAWLEAEAALPNGWQLLGVVKGPRQVDPRISSAEWCAWARPAREEADYRTPRLRVGLRLRVRLPGPRAHAPLPYPPVEGRGDSPLAALTALARNLREMAAE